MLTWRYEGSWTMDHRSWCPPLSHLAAAESLDLLRTTGLALLQLDTSTHLFSQPLILHSDHLPQRKTRIFVSSIRFRPNFLDCSLWPSSDRSPYLHLLDFGVGVEELLDLGRVDVLPSPNDHVLDAALDTAVS